MPVFGSLGDFGLSDVLMLLGNRQGSLDLRSIPGYSQPITVSVANGEILSISQGGEALDPERASALLKSLLRQAQGEFEFTDCPSEHLANCRNALRWPLERALLTAGQQETEWSAYQRAFSDPRTKFEATSAEVQLDDSLRDFWGKAERLLKSDGATAEELSEKLAMPLEQAQFYLYELRLAGLVTPARGHSREQASKRDLWRQVLGALRK